MSLFFEETLCGDKASLSNTISILGYMLFVFFLLDDSNLS